MMKLQPKMKWAICPCCHGNGQVENPAFDNGFTSSEWGDMEEDGREAYLRGDYDIPCKKCGTSGKVQIPDVAAMTFAEKRELVVQRREMRAEADADRQIQAEIAAERRMGC